MEKISQKPGRRVCQHVNALTRRFLQRFLLQHSFPLQEKALTAGEGAIPQAPKKNATQWAMR
ncbi:MAG: hypothetical protein LBJ38_01475 [Oscillospiraceae bacterium]|nr:hypothetical protein [Oscillospiraceae bacterium]